MLRRMNESHYVVTGWALEHWKIRENDRILDIGCGGGATLKRMSEEVRDGHLTGVDYSATSLELSGKTNAEGKNGSRGSLSGKTALCGQCF